MWPVSERFLKTLRYSHTKITRVDLYHDNQPEVTDLPVLDVVVEDDSTADVRLRCEVSLPATSEMLALLPQNPELRGGLWPLGNELRIRSGIRFEDGTEELVPMGVFRISKPGISSTSQGERTIRIQGYDRSRAVSRSAFVNPYQITLAAMDIPTEIKMLIMSRLPMLTDDDFVLMSSSHIPPPVTFLRDNDPWKDAVVPLAKSIGADVFFNGEGKLVLKPFTNPASDPISFEYIEGTEAIILALDRQLDDEDAYNGVVVVGKSSEEDVAPPRGQAWDTDPLSPTYFDPAYPDLSHYGAVPYFFESEVVVTDEQAKDAASGLLLDVMGVIESIDFTSICNPAQRSGDLIRVKNEDTNVDELASLISLRFGLGQEDWTMSGTTKRRKLND